MKYHKGTMYFKGFNNRWFVNHPGAYSGGYPNENAALKFIDKVTK